MMFLGKRSKVIDEDLTESKQLLLRYAFIACVNIMNVYRAGLSDTCL